MLVLIDLAGDEFQKASLEISIEHLMHVHPYFCTCGFTCGFRREWGEASLSFAIMGHGCVSIFMVKRVTENFMAAEVRDLVMTDRVFEMMRTFLGDS
jgi:hypothetical protein